MKKNTTFHNLFQKIVSEDEVNVIQDAIGYKDTARKLTVHILIHYLTCAAMNEFKSYRECADVGDKHGLPKVDHSTISKKAGHVDYKIMKELFHLVVSKCNRMTRRALKISKELLLVDSTTITVGKSRLPWALYHGERAGIKLHVSYTPLTEMPLQVVETTGLVHDGPIGEQLVDSRFIMVEDRAYFKIKRIDQFTEDQQKFVIRIKENVEIFRPHALQRLEQAGSPITRDITCQLGTKQSRSKNRHRVVFFKDDYGNEMRVVTNVVDVAPEVIADMYKARWRIETFFRWIKQNLNVPVLFGTTENAVFNQLFAALIAYVLLKWLYSKTAEGRIFKKLSFISFLRQLQKDNLPIDWRSEMAVIFQKL
ncbi:MAG TPA: IS4 family transposase [Bacillus bacterium]|nr:IS4 family transposase [Bacillus sp. (in: firmicutes)]